VWNGTGEGVVSERTQSKNNCAAHIANPTYLKGTMDIGRLIVCIKGCVCFPGREAFVELT
jgi:hypothetical protein